MPRLNISEVEELQRKINIALAEDKLWLAREYYSSLIRVSGYDQSIYKGYADLLVEMREDLVAGKFYFLSGDRGDDAARCIALFMERYRRRKLGSIGSQFPKVAQRMDVVDFPEPIKSELMGWGFSGSSRTTNIERNESRLSGFLVTSLIVVVLLSIPIGIISMIRWLISLWN